MDVVNAFDQIKVIKVESPTDKIIIQIKQMISDGILKPGDRLDRFGVGRGYVREAIMKLEFYGLLKTSPQSGTYVSGFNLKILDTIFSDILSFNKDNFASIIEARFHTEVTAARLAALRRTESDIVHMKDALRDYDAVASKGNPAVQEDMLFHIKIANASKNPVIESMMLTLIPDLISGIIDNYICEHKDHEKVINEHHDILNAIIERNADAAEEATERHLKEILHFYNGLH
jgi:GntR family transcriptional repressor for pyruvate dehydrogenase complex